MVTAESERSRRVIGRLDKGSDLLAALAEVCKKHRIRTATMTGLGALERVEICEYDQRNRVYKPARAFEGNFEVLNLTGNISDRDNKPFVHAHITVSRERDNGIELLGGHLLSARVFAFEFVLDVMDDLVLKRTVDQATGLALWSEAISFEPEADPTRAHPTWDAGNVPASSDVASRTFTAPELKTNPGWAAVMEMSKQAPPSSATISSEIRVKAGDLIDHPKFQRCVVERIEGDYEFVQVRLSNRRLVRLSLDVLSFVPAGQEGNATIYKARLGGE